MQKAISHDAAHIEIRKIAFLHMYILIICSMFDMHFSIQTLLRRLHNEGVQVLTISELQYLNRSLSSPDIPRDADLESLKAGWENERQSYLSTIQSLKDLLAQTHKLRGLDKASKLYFYFENKPC